MKILIFLMNLLIFSNIFSAALTEKEITALQEKRTVVLKNKVFNLKSNRALDRFSSLFNLLNFGVEKLKKPPYNDFQKSLYDEVNVLITRLENYLKEPRGPGQDKAAKNILNAEAAFKKIIDQHYSITTTEYKVKEAKSPEEQVDADIDLARNLPKDLLGIVGDYSQLDIKKANENLLYAKTDEQIKEALNSGANSINNVLVYSIEGGSFETMDLQRIQSLIRNGADVNAVVLVPINVFERDLGYKEITPLFRLIRAAVNSRAEAFPILKILLDAGADINFNVRGISFRDYLNAPGSEELLKLYNDYMKQKTEGKKS